MNKNSFTIVIIVLLTLLACRGITDNNENEFPNENTFESENHITAYFKYDEVETYAQSIDSVLRLKHISSDDVNYEGFSKSWSYKYSKIIDSTFTSKHYYICSFYDSVYCDSIVIKKTTLGDAFILQSWLNSDIIMEIAENNGGKDFRKNNSDYNIYNSLNQAVVPNSRPIWTIRYTSKTNDSNFHIRINAVSGAIE